MPQPACRNSHCHAYTRALDAWLSAAVYVARAQRKYLENKDNAHAADMVSARRSHYKKLFEIMLAMGMDMDRTKLRMLETKITNGSAESVERIRARLLAENASEGAGN